MCLLGSLPAHAAPGPVGPSTTPSNSTDAKTAWDNSSRQAEIASEQVDGAQQAELADQQIARSAAAKLIAARATVASTVRAAAAADVVVASYQVKVDAFANASFQGARLSQFSVMLTATSADDFLDESTVINRVAQDTQQTLHDAIAAKTSAARAQADAQAAETAAAQAKTEADQAAAAAVAATASAVSKKTELDAAVASYKNLYNKLSAQEKAAAAAAAERIRQQSIAAAAAQLARDEADAAAAAAAAAQPVVSTTPLAIQAVDTKSVSSPPSTSSATSSTASTTTSAPQAAVSGGDAKGEIAARAALTKVGFAYVYAGNGPDAFDCSGLTTWAWAQAGIAIPRVSYLQANFPSVPLDQLEPGDLVTYFSPVSHVAIYVGNGMVVSAADPAEGIVLRPVDGAGPDPTGHRVPR